ncbi:MAG: hypothetical protein IJD39_02425 [Clostridia bacterium]|nr:hypothetical protein [Clostridia bacterium]
MSIHLDQMRRHTLDYLDALWADESIGGGHKYMPEGRVSILSTSNAAWIYHLLQAHDKIGKYGKDASSWLKSQQQPDGRFIHDPARHPKYCAGPSHALFVVSRALDIYGCSLESTPAYLVPLLSAEQLDQWFSAIDWKGESSSHHDVLAIVAGLKSAPSSAWLDTLFSHLDRQQDQDTGCWSFNWRNLDANLPNMSRSFAYTNIYINFGRIPPHADQMIETAIALQKPSGIWEHFMDLPEYFTMDAVFLIWRIGNLIHYPLEKRLPALLRAADAMDAHFSAHPPSSYDQLHSLTATLETLALLGEAFPERYPASIPWLFDWTKKF